MHTTKVGEVYLHVRKITTLTTTHLLLLRGDLILGLVPLGFELMHTHTRSSTIHSTEMG